MNASNTALEPAALAAADFAPVPRWAEYFGIVRGCK